MSSQVMVPGLRKLRRLAYYAWVRSSSQLIRLAYRLAGAARDASDANNSSAPYGGLLMNPHAAEIMRDFRWRDYLRLNRDLSFASPQQASQHFAFKGYNEQRLIDLERLRKLAPAFYRSRHPELKLGSNFAAKVHYSYVGHYEKRIANDVDEWVSQATLHIYQPGKVGSHAIAKAIDGKYPGGALHLHWPTDLPMYFPLCSLTYPDLVNLPRPRRLRVISAGRDIVAQILSGAFQYLSTIPIESKGRAGLEYVQTYLGGAFEANGRVFEHWFDHQFYCGMDIYAHHFDHARGFIQLSNQTIDLFLYRQENLSQLDTALGQFLDIADFRLERANSAESKAYSTGYRELFNKYIVPAPLLERLYSTRYMQFFFSAQERERLMERWSRPRTN